MLCMFLDPSSRTKARETNTHAIGTSSGEHCRSDAGVKELWPDTSVCYKIFVHPFLQRIGWKTWMSYE